MGRKTSRARESAELQQRQHPLTEKLFFQQLPPDIQTVVLEGVKFRLSSDPLREQPGRLYRDDLLDEEADDIINRYNWGRTVQEWLRFAEDGETQDGQKHV